MLCSSPLHQQGNEAATHESKSIFPVIFDPDCNSQLCVYCVQTALGQKRSGMINCFGSDLFPAVKVILDRTQKYKKVLCNRKGTESF